MYVFAASKFLDSIWAKNNMSNQSL